MLKKDKIDLIIQEVGGRLVVDHKMGGKFEKLYLTDGDSLTVSFPHGDLECEYRQDELTEDEKFWKGYHLMKGLKLPKAFLATLEAQMEKRRRKAVGLQR